MERVKLDLSRFSVALRKHVDPSSPTPLRMMAAKGLLPMAPQEMALVLYQLGNDDDRKVADTSIETFSGTPDDLVRTAATADLPVTVLDWMAEVFSDRDDVVSDLVVNPAIHPDSVTRVAKRASSTVCDLIAENQVRLLAHPKIIESLYMNPNARMSTVDKIVDLARRNGVKLEGLPSLRPLMESKEPIIQGAAPDSDPASQEDDLFRHFLEEGWEADGQIEAVDDLDDEEASADQGRRLQNRALFLSSLSVSQRIRVALLGSQADRAYLVRETNRLVHMAAITSPKATDKEALAWSANPTIPEGVISYIATQREWIRHYQMKLNLVNNPKTPLSRALHLLPFLYPRDLRKLSKNRNVSSTLARQAKDLEQKRASGRK